MDFNIWDWIAVCIVPGISGRRYLGTGTKGEWLTAYMFIYSG